MAPKADSRTANLARSGPAITPLGVIAPPPIHVTAPTFDGSLATLFYCVRERKLDLLEIPLAPICEAYFEYLLISPATTLEEAAAALVALAYLLERKAWLLLPNSEPEPQAAEDLVALPATTHEFAIAIDALRVWHEERSQLFFRSPDAGPDPYELPYTLANVSVRDLARAFERVLSRATEEPEAPKVRPRRALSEVIACVLLAVSDVWRPMDDLLPEGYTRVDAVYFFLALLELIRLGQVAVRLEDQLVEFARGK